MNDLITLLSALLLGPLVGFAQDQNHVQNNEARGEEKNKSNVVATITVEPTTTRAIEGISQLQRQRYFTISDDGVGFEQRVGGKDRYRYLVDELQINFGRRLGPVRRWARSLEEDSTRPEHADLTTLSKNTTPKPSKGFHRDFPDGLDIAAHGSPGAYPDFMGKHETKASAANPKHPQSVPRNMEASAELAEAVFQKRYTDFDRPRYFEPINEPHWSLVKERELADWHVVMHERFKKSFPDVKVGGPCLPTCYFYRNEYRSFEGLKNFMAATKGKLDFYSFHVYDYHRWKNNQFEGRIQSGLPLEGALDLFQNHAVNTYGRTMDVVVSEQGGYIGSKPKGDYDGDLVTDEILALVDPTADSTTWEHEMRKRSIVNFGCISSFVANTLTFMDHPHTVKKSICFTQLNTWNWAPQYYAQMFVPHKYTDKTRWVETDMTKFFRLFRGVSGRRVKAICDSPDLQSRGFVNGSKVWLVINNQSRMDLPVNVEGLTSAKISIRRLGRNADYTTAYSEETIATPKNIIITGRESIVIKSEVGAVIPSGRTVNEIACYGDKITQPMETASFVIKTPLEETINYAQLRIGLTRSPDSQRTPIVKLNGKTLTVPFEASSDRFTDREYASTKLIPVNPADLKNENTVVVKFADGNDGAVGSVVLRIAIDEN